MFITWMIHLLRWYLDDVHIETPPRRHKKHRTYYKPRSLGKIDQHIQHLTKLRNDWGTWPSTWNPLAPQCELRSCFEALIHERFFWWATSTSTSVSLAYACVPYTKWITHTHTQKYTTLSKFDRYLFKLIMQSSSIVSQPIIKMKTAWTTYYCKNTTNFNQWMNMKFVCLCSNKQLKTSSPTPSIFPPYHSHILYIIFPWLLELGFLPVQLATWRVLPRHVNRSSR